MKNFSLALKISLGFALLILIACILGIMSIWRMGTVKSESEILAHEYVPEVEIANEVRGASNRVMYEMRGYALSEEMHYYEKALKEIEALESQIERARALEAKAVHLKKLKGQLQIITTAVNEYKSLMDQTLETDKKMDAARDVLDASAGTYMSNSEAFLQGQNEKFKKDLESRNKKIGYITALVHIGSETRVANFKAQAERSASMMEKAALILDKADEPLAAISSISSDKADIDRIDAIRNAAYQYKKAMSLFAEQLKRGAGADRRLMAQYKKQMDESAGIYVRNCDEYLKGQQEKLIKDMHERHEKIRLASEIMNLGNNVRIRAFKSQALRDPAVMREGLALFPKIEAAFIELKKITYLPEDLRRIEEVREAGNTYKTAMETFLSHWLAQQEIGKQREETGRKVIEACKNTAEAGMEATNAISREAVANLSSASVIMIIGLIVALVVGFVVALTITRSITLPINKIINGLNEGSNQVASAAGQVSSSSQSMAEGASEQAAALEETSTSMEEMTSMTKSNTENAANADKLMKDANVIVGEANDSMTHLIKSMEDISAASEETSKIIKTIDEIAFQTNLLALNAAVEAARAGEAGAGFAVVADEVRSLAIRAAEAAKNTAELIEGTVKKVNDGSDLVTTTNEAFTKVAESSDKVGTLVAEISEASREQSNGFDQINTAVGEMDRVVQQNAANAEESASAAEEMSAQAEQLKEYVDNLVLLVSGNKSKTAGTSAGGGQHLLKNISDKIHKKTPQKKQMLSHTSKEVRPDQVIPFDDDESFEDF